MARKSRKQAVIQAPETADTSLKVYCTALYARLSADENNREAGTTIENQLCLLREYVKDKPYLQVISEYFDDGVTGTVFDRPSFNRMIADMRAGKINCIIVKDLSRLGRNYLEAGDYIEKIFPFFNVRFIAVTDGYDSSSSDITEDGLIVPLKNLINDIYAKDLSQKIGSALHVRQKQGKYIGVSAPYGYVKDPADHGKLVVDGEVKEIVRDIFHRRADGESLTGIVRKLNDDGIPSPSLYQYMKGRGKTVRSELWTVSTLSTLLENSAYVGDMEQGIRKTSLCQGIKRHRVSAEERICVRNTHEPIVEREIFEKVALMKKADREKYHASYGMHGELSKEPNLLKGILVCADCGRLMQLRRDSSGAKLDPPRAYYRYVCPTYQNLKEKGCTKKHLNKKETEQAVEEAVRLHIKLFLDSRKALDGLNRTEQAGRINDGYQKEISEACRRKKKAQQRAGALYNDYADGLLNESDYLYAKQKYLDEAAAAEQRILELRNMQKKYNKGFTKDSRLETMAGQYIDFDVLTDEIVHAFIEKVYVHSDKSLEICFRFRDELEELVQTVEERKGEICRTETDM